ncbi:cupredoxin family protein [Microvirga sp. Mcv34]|uniref:cupredoxin domain-containing protein n=1 Tax=Microvirga sp. Mcv34 TaxID=2926016 RepID=UPI0021C7BC3A|nr:cupredoxin family protein [Microvirga sp. Mcv34]
MKKATTLLGGLSALLLTTGLALAGPGGAGHGHGDEAAYGKPGDPKKPARLVQVSMRETDGKMLFFPDKVEVKAGEQVRFKLANNGEAEHEFVLATVEENAKHKIQMEKNPDMEHEDPNARRLQPKKGDEIVWQFTKAGTFEYACLIPGHYESGMKGTVVVK